MVLLRKQEFRTSFIIRQHKELRDKNVIHTNEYDETCVTVVCTNCVSQQQSRAKKHGILQKFLYELHSFRFSENIILG